MDSLFCFRKKRKKRTFQLETKKGGAVGRGDSRDTRANSCQSRGPCITNIYQPKQCIFIRELPHNYHTCVLFDFPKMGNLLTPVRHSKAPRPAISFWSAFLRNLSLDETFQLENVLHKIFNGIFVCKFIREVGING